VLGVSGLLAAPGVDEVAEWQCNAKRKPSSPVRLNRNIPISYKNTVPSSFPLQRYTSCCQTQVRDFDTSIPHLNINRTRQESDVRLDGERRSTLRVRLYFRLLIPWTQLEQTPFSAPKRGPFCAPRKAVCTQHDAEFHLPFASIRIYNCPSHHRGTEAILIRSQGDTLHHPKQSCYTGLVRFQRPHNLQKLAQHLRPTTPSIH
jgi:hypothetical protein